MSASDAMGPSTGSSPRSSRSSNETKTRVITGVLGGAVLLLLVTVGGHIGVSLVAAVIAGVMCFEAAKIFFRSNDAREKMIALVGTSWLIIFVNMLLPKVMLECLVVAFMGLFAYYLAIADRHAENLRTHFEEFVYTTFTLVYVVTFVAFLPLIRAGGSGIQWLLLFLLIVWAGDTGAYFVGRKYGKTKLYPLISPGKSVQGAIGGLLSSVLVAIIFKLAAFKGLSWVGVVVTPILVGVVSQIGDLCESFLKRAYGVKDSGQILPGHGGMLDRFDGVLLSLPVMYFCVKVFS